MLTKNTSQIASYFGAFLIGFLGCWYTTKSEAQLKLPSGAKVILMFPLDGVKRELGSLLQIENSSRRCRIHRKPAILVGKDRRLLVAFSKRDAVRFLARRLPRDPALRSWNKQTKPCSVRRKRVNYGR